MERSNISEFISTRLIFGLMFAWLGWGMNARATHLVGGDFYYVHLGGDQYQITLKVYRDCSPANTNGTGFDESVIIGMWDGTGIIGAADVINIPLVLSNVSNVPVEMGNPCGTPPPELCIEQAIYTATATLRRPPTAGTSFTRGAVETLRLSIWMILEGQKMRG